MLAVAEAVVPDQRPVVTHDPGPVNPGVLFDGRGTATVCRVTVETGNPKAPDPSATVDAAAATLRARGWTADVVPEEDGHYRVVEALPEFKGIPPHDQNPFQLLPIRRRKVSQDSFQSGRAEVLLDEAEASLQYSSLDLLHKSERLGIAGCLTWPRRSIHCCRLLRRAMTDV